MLDVAHVLLYCTFALGFRDERAVRDVRDSGVMSAQWYDEMRATMMECDPIAIDARRDFPDLRRGKLGIRGRTSWLERASARGSRVARLEFLEDLPSHSAEIAQLLDELVDLRDPYVLLRAGQFMSMRSTVGDDREYQQWTYLACLSHPRCSAEHFRSSLRERFPVGVQIQVTAFAENFAGREAVGLSFAEIQRTQPYTLIAEEVLTQIEAQQRIDQATRSAASTAVDRP